MKNLQNLTSKIKGSLYGFAIGDAMGATTEFMDKNIIKVRYGKISDIIGGGWLRLEPGEVTDDTQMTMCVCDAIRYAFGDKKSFHYDDNLDQSDVFLSKCCYNFTKWYLSEPDDIGGCCRRVIEKCRYTTDPKYWFDIADNSNSLGNGSLMRTMPIILSGQSEDLARLQGRLTHNNTACDVAISMYYQNMEEILYHDTFRTVARCAYEPEGHVVNTLNNALYWTQHSDSFEDAIVSAVNDGGDADTIAAITGSLAGALYGYDAIPQRWIGQLDAKVKRDLDFYAKLFEKINKKVCTNTK